MECTLVTLLLVNIIAGNTLHASVVPYPTLLHYSDGHSPLLLTHHLGLSNEAVLAAAGLTLAPAPVAEGNQESVDGSNAASLSNEIHNSQSLPEQLIAIQNAQVTSGLSELPAAAPSSAAAALPELKSGSEAPLQTPAANPESTADGESLTLIPALPVPTEIASGLPLVVATANASKSLGGSNVNVNVHVNVNGDGTASVYNATSVADIKAPVEVEHEIKTIH